MYRFLLIAAFLPALVIGLTYTECFEGSGPKSVSITGCPEAPCRIVRGSTVNMTLGFAHEDAIESAEAHVIATAFGVTVPYPLPPAQSNVCGRLTVGECPLDANEDAVYVMEMEIVEDYPITTLVLQIEIRDTTWGDDKIISCFSFPAETVLG